MKQKILGKTGIIVPEAGFGVLALGRTHRGLSDRDGAELMTYALSKGINFFDTAQYYEEYPLISTFLKAAVGEHGYKRSDIVVCTKSLAADYEGMNEAVEEALNEMELDHIDIFLMHEVRSGQLDERAGAWEALKNARKAGKVRAIGLSTHHVDVVWEASEIEGCDCVFALLNIEGMGIRRAEAGGPGGALPGYWIEDRAGARSEMEEALQACHDKGLGVFTMKALGGGNLAADYVEALDYAFSRPFTDCVMLGMSSKHEIDDLLEYLDGKLEADFTPDISSKVLKVNHDDCVGCGSCMKACASGAVFFAEDGLAEIDLKKCIDCGYCAYACPVRAIIRV